MAAEKKDSLERVYVKKEMLLMDANNVIGKTSDTSVQNYIEVDGKVRWARFGFFFFGLARVTKIICYVVNRNN